MAPKHNFTILSMMKDEGHSLVEWVAYHHLIGFDNICVYTNNCSDGTDHMLTRLQELGYAKHFLNDVKPGGKPQPHALKIATENAEVMDSAWILVIDADEFLNVKIGNGQVADLVAALPQASDGITINWRFFGSNGIVDWVPDTVIDRFTGAAPDDFRQGWGVKTLFRPYPGVRLGIHRPHMLDQREEPERLKILLDQKWVNGSGKPLEDDFKLSGWRLNKHFMGYDLAEVNHYAVKSHEAYLLRRLRGNVNNKANKYDENYMALFDRNEVRLTQTAARLPAVRTVMDKILADPQMQKLQEQANDFHQDQIAKLRASEHYQGWREELARATAVSYGDLDDILFMQSMPKDWRDKVLEMRANGMSDKEITAALSDKKTARGGGKRQRMREQMDEAISAGAKPGGTLHKKKFVPGVAIAPATDKVTALSEKDEHKAKKAARKDIPEFEADPTRGPLETELPPEHRRGPGSSQGAKVVVSTMKNEAPYLLEWIAHYQSVGFDHFVIYSNDCTDGTNLMLNRLQQLGMITHYDNPLSERRKDPQRSAYSRARRAKPVQDAEWVMIVDADEFVNIRIGDGKITDLIDHCADADAISLCWQLMGSDGQVHMSEDPVSHRFHRAANLAVPENGLVWGFKTLFRNAAFDYFGVHRPRFLTERNIGPGYVKWVNGSGRDMAHVFYEKGWRFNSERLGYDLGVVNHYAVKSKEEFLLKRARGTANSKDKDRIDLEYWDKFDLNGQPAIPLKDTGMLDHLAKLKADTVLGSLHKAALENARLGIAEHLRDDTLRSFVMGPGFAIGPEATGASEPVKTAAPIVSNEPRILCLGAHHKTGTVWMRRTFHKFAEAEGIPVLRADRSSELTDLPATGAALVVNWASEFPAAFFDHPEARFLHMIRDPRDVLLSGYRYHLTAPTGNEKFLRTPRDDLAGLSYQEHLNSLPDRNSGLLFEMAGKHAETLVEMLAWPYGHPQVVDLRYEDMIGDDDCALFRAAIATMGLQGFDAERLTKSYWTHSLFGGLADKANRKANVTAHVRSGKSEQWRTKLPREVAEVYADRHGYALKALGYAMNDDWVAECQPTEVLAERAAAE